MKQYVHRHSILVLVFTFSWNSISDLENSTIRRYKEL